MLSVFTNFWKRSKSNKKPQKIKTSSVRSGEDTVVEMPLKISLYCVFPENYYN